MITQLCYKAHKTIVCSRPLPSLIVLVIFVEEPRTQNLHWRKDYWFNKIKAKINVNKLIYRKLDDSSLLLLSGWFQA